MGRRLIGLGVLTVRIKRGRSAVLLVLPGMQRMKGNAVRQQLLMVIVVQQVVHQIVLIMLRTSTGTTLVVTMITMLMPVLG